MSDDAIVGGQPDEMDPAVVALNIESTGIAVCSGTLIARGVVLTAGHCPQSGIWVRQGSNVHGLGWFGHASVKDAVKHPSFTGEGKPYDVALLHLDGSDLDTIAPALLSSAALGPNDIGATIRHVGFGTTGDEHYIKDIATGGLKREVSYPITRVDDTFVYSGAPGQQTCLFDSGGPAFRTVDGVERIVGVVSAGDDCHSDGWDTRVDRADVLSWIDQQLAAWGTRRP